MLNLQLAEKPIHRLDGVLDVVDVFYTIQGEGPLAGEPAVFVRLAGCNLQCAGCDTDYTSNRREYLPPALLEHVRAAAPGCRQIVLTGGEPFRQRISPFCNFALDRGYQVQIETNGTLFDPDLYLSDDPSALIVCSPKTPTINQRLAQHIHAWKYVMEADHVDPTDGLPTSVLGEPVRPARAPQRDQFGYPEIYLQPVDVGDTVRNDANTQAVVQSCLRHGYKLCLQMHKIVGLA